MSACRECPKCRGWAQLRNRAGNIIDCPRCHFALTGEDSERDEREAREHLRGAESPREGTEAHDRLLHVWVCAVRCGVRCEDEDVRVAKARLEEWLTENDGRWVK